VRSETDTNRITIGLTLRRTVRKISRLKGVVEGMCPVYSDSADPRLLDALAATLAEHGKVPTLAAYDSGNLLSVATSIRERWPDKAIVIAGDDDHRIENNPGRKKALAAAEAVAGVAIFPNFSAEQRAQGFTDFNDLWVQNPELVSQQLTSTKTFETRLIGHSLAADKDLAISY
jgi:hypothetical protein